MRVHRDGSSTPLIDASVSIYPAGNVDLRSFMREPYTSRGFPDVDPQYWYATPGGEFAPDTTGPGGEYPGSDPELVGGVLFGERGTDVAVVHPMTRGIMPDRYLGTAILSAHNEMMVSRWLEGNRYAERYRGTVRVNPDDVAGAVREIERWKDHPRVVQVGIPLQSREVYGKPQYWPLWEAAAAAGLPVAVHIETGAGIGNPPTPSGHTLTYEQYLGFMPLNFVYHLLNMMAEGVFEKYDLKMVWADGAGDFVTPFSWRMDTFGRPHLEQTPWAPKMPSDYLPGHVYFVEGSLDGPGDTDFAGQWLSFTGKEDMVMYGSSFPGWQLNDPDRLPAALSAEQRDKVCWRNAAELYGIELPAAVTS